MSAGQLSDDGSGTNNRTDSNSPLGGSDDRGKSSEVTDSFAEVASVSELHSMTEDEKIGLFESFRNSNSTK